MIGGHPRRAEAVRLASLLIVLGALAALCLPDESEPPLEAAPAAFAGDTIPGDVERDMRRIRVPDGFDLSLFACEPLLANPVSFSFDQQGRCYVVETYRIQRGVFDIRDHMDWLDDDLASRTIADRVAMYRKHLGPRFADLAREEDRLRRVEDRDGDGRADSSTVFADGFREPADGLAAGVLARGVDVWFTCIPSLWRLGDRDGDGRAESRQALHSGYGVHVGFYGHDLHGLCFGPDGRLYFSIGDRGLHVEHDGQTLDYADTGAVLRCLPDGSQLEVFAYGLRNPQELAFDEYGNLFTGDNNSDSGDRARWVHVVEGGDSGWRIGFQFLESPYSRGPWNAERMWLPSCEGQPAYIVPPLANLADGPSGLCYYPWDDPGHAMHRHFFLADFRGASAASGIRTFSLKPKGASFELVGDRPFAWGVLATDVEFGPDGAMYIADWVEGWEGTGKGRILRLADERFVDSDEARHVKELLSQGLHHSPASELAALLAHRDQRIRQEAQFALAARGAESIAVFEAAARGGPTTLSRLHGIWGLGQVGSGDPAAAACLVELLSDASAAVRAQAARVAGELRLPEAAARLAAALRDSEASVAFFAAIALGKLKRTQDVPALVELLERNDDGDAYLRHAAVMGLTGIGDTTALAEAAGHPSPAVRMGIVLALRRLASPETARFLADADPAVASEAARAVYDVPITEGYSALAEFTGRPELPEPFLRRAINARARLGSETDAAALAQLAADPRYSETARLEALAVLGEWPAPASRDRVLGLWRPIHERAATPAASALRQVIAGLFDVNERLSRAAALACVRLNVVEVAPLLKDVFADRSRSPALRAGALDAQGALGAADLDATLEAALVDDEPQVRAAARRVLAQRDPNRALGLLAAASREATTLERQAALAELAKWPTRDAEAVIETRLDEVLAGTTPPEIVLDVLLAAQHRGSQGPLAEKLARFEASRPADDPLAAYREVLVGGDAERGRAIVLDRTSVECLRCHKLEERGGEIGPDLSRIAADKSREYLLESIVIPNRQIAKGFESVVLVLTDGRIETGIVKAENGEILSLATPEGALQMIPVDEIDERYQAPSAMPDTLADLLSKSELRDVIEFLAGLN